MFIETKSEIFYLSHLTISLSSDAVNIPMKTFVLFPNTWIMLRASVWWKFKILVCAKIEENIAEKSKVDR